MRRPSFPRLTSRGSRVFWMSVAARGRTRWSSSGASRASAVIFDLPAVLPRTASYVEEAGLWLG